MKIACVGYREWALNIYEKLVANNNEHTYLIVRSHAEFDEQAIIDFEPDLALFYGWSWKISQTLISTIDCIMLHPAPLPLYRGGSPIQNQIIAGETSSAVTLFVMTDEIDAGDIVGQKIISLEGSLNQILERISEVGLELTQNILLNGLIRKLQDHTQATLYKRLKPSDSEITIQELQSASGLYIYNKIRMLADPYPNAFIRTSDGKKLLIKNAELALDYDN